MENIDTVVYRVLVVDDDESVRRLLSIVLPLDGSYEVVGEAGDGLAAIAAAELLQPDIIVLDHMMPILTGAAAYPRIKEVAPKTKVVFFSAYLERSDFLDELDATWDELDCEFVPKSGMGELELALDRIKPRRHPVVTSSAG